MCRRKRKKISWMSVFIFEEAKDVKIWWNWEIQFGTSFARLWVILKCQRYNLLYSITIKLPEKSCIGWKGFLSKRRLQNSRIFRERGWPSIFKRKCKNGEGEWGETSNTLRAYEARALHTQGVAVDRDGLHLFTTSILIRSCYKDPCKRCVLAGERYRRFAPSENVRNDCFTVYSKRPHKSAISKHCQSTYNDTLRCSYHLVYTTLEWIVLFVPAADWLARRWLAKYYSPPLWRITVKYLSTQCGTCSQFNSIHHIIILILL